MLTEIINSDLRLVIFGILCGFIGGLSHTVLLIIWHVISEKWEYYKKLRMYG